MKSFRPKDDDDSDNNGWGDFRGKKRSNLTHESKTDGDARLMRKGLGKEAKLSYAGHALMENRNGLLVDFELTLATGTAERDAAKTMLGRLRRKRRATVGADRGYDTRDFVGSCRGQGVTPHVARYNKGTGRRGSAIDGRTARHPGYVASQKVR